MIFKNKLFHKNMNTTDEWHNSYVYKIMSTFCKQNNIPIELINEMKLDNGYKWAKLAYNDYIITVHDEKPYGFFNLTDKRTKSLESYDDVFKSQEFFTNHNVKHNADIISDRIRILNATRRINEITDRISQI